MAREEGATPAIVESILRRALARWRANPNLELLGDYAFDPAPATGAATGRRSARRCRSRSLLSK